MVKYISSLFIGVIVSLFYFSFGFTFLPPGINTKMLLAVVGIAMASYHAVQKRTVTIDRPMMGAIGLAVLFSLICFLAVDHNFTDDYSYATYFVSFGVWIFSAYAVCTLIRAVHGTINLRLLTIYLASVCFAQCVLALLIEWVPAFQLWVDTYIDQGQEFLLQVDRIYGIGASLDNAGVRFSIVLVMIAGVLSRDSYLLESRPRIILMLTAFFGIVIIGNIMSRTTFIGTGMAIFYFMWNTGTIRLHIRPQFFKFQSIFLVMLVTSIAIITYFYYTNEIFQEQIRFGFEGFFNWVEIGEWRTDSTDKLNKYMWIWPESVEGWIIGTGLFDDWVYGTDIGYCRFILYCGLPGFMIFASFFIYHAVVFSERYSDYRLMFFLLMMLSFIIWIKVSTDIFIIYALFYCMYMLRNSNHLNQKDENSLLHSRYV